MRSCQGGVQQPCLALALVGLGNAVSEGSSELVLDVGKVNP